MDHNCLGRMEPFCSVHYEISSAIENGNYCTEFDMVYEKGVALRSTQVKELQINYGVGKGSLLE